MNAPLRIFAALLAAILLSLPAHARAQAVIPPAAPGVVGGVAIAPDGFLQMRQIAPALSPRPDAGKPDQLYISLPRVLGQWKAAKDAGKEVPADVRYLHGLTQIQNIFLFPDDLILAGPAEPIKADNPLEPLGARSGRPIVQLEDLIVTLRAVNGAAGNNREPGFFGCSLEPPANLQQVWQPTLDRLARAPRAQLQQEMKKALGPQPVVLYGVPEDARVALAMVAADYRLKRMCMGLESLPPGIGNALGAQNAAPRIWFEPAYEPLLQSPDGNSYEIRGPRLKVLAGVQLFTAGGVGDAQKKFVDSLSAKIPEVAARLDAVADLQNITDCFLVAALIRHDNLLEKAHCDLAWLFDAGSPQYKTPSLPVPRTADTVVHIAGNVIAQGGVSIHVNSLISLERTPSDKPQTASPARPTTTWYLAKSK